MLRALKVLRCVEVRLHHVTLDNVSSLFADLSDADRQRAIVFNMCDGTEHDSFPGISVVHRLEELGMRFTGAGGEFYEISTFKTRMKRLFDANGVPTSPWMMVDVKADRATLSAQLDALGYPLIVKPDDSYASCGIQEDNVVHSASKAIDKATSVAASFANVYVEKYIRGREFSGLVTGDEEFGVRTWPVAERAFDTSLHADQQFMSFELFWEINRNSKKDEWWLQAAEDTLQPLLQDAVRRAYLAVRGTGYARVDMRYDPKEHRVYVLEVNAQCGLSGFEETIMGQILLYSRVTLAGLLDHFFVYATQRRRRNWRRQRQQLLDSGRGLPGVA
jgi:D-alanine-D-alanine ligase